MNTAAGLIERVAQLSREDRDWILGHLSAPAKASLLSQLDQGEPALPDDSTTRSDERALNVLDGEVVAGALASEPSWLIAMILGLHSWRWEPQVLARLAPVTRLEVNQLRDSLPQLAPAMRGLLTRTLREQFQAAPQNSRFEQLLDRVMERAP